MNDEEKKKKNENGPTKIELDFPDNISLELSKISNWLLLNLDETSVFTDLYGEIRQIVWSDVKSNLYVESLSLSLSGPLMGLG